jgi:hypothetical protein
MRTHHATGQDGRLELVLLDRDVGQVLAGAVGPDQQTAVGIDHQRRRRPP